VVSLVHELPGVIESMGLRARAQAIAACAQAVVFAGDEVRAAFERFAPLKPGQAVLRTQGLYKRNRFRDAAAIAGARAALRGKLGVPADARVVLNVGYADQRKGIDLFMEMGLRLVRADPRVHLAWVGHHDPELMPKLLGKIAASGLGAHFHFPGRDADTDPWYAGSDLLALTSREDPFPTVIMEALDVGVPVVAFAGAGGFDALLARTGELVPALDTAAFAAACARLLADDETRRRLGEEGRARVDRDYDFPAYVRDLLGLLGDGPRVSVVVPNYNYARYLPQRLASIFAQDPPPFEVIVLDDGSTDDSLAVLAELSKRHPIRVVAGEANSGSVFRQWQRGVREARGDLVWIAEADDLAEPNFLSSLLPAFRHPEVVMAYAQSRQIDPKGETLEPDYLDYVSDFDASRWEAPYFASLDQELRHGLAVKNTIPNVSAVLFRRSALASVLEQHLDEIAAFRVAGDWQVYVRVLELGHLAFEPDVLNLHRRHRGSVTLGGDSRRHLEEVRRVQEWIRSRHRLDAHARESAARYLDFLAGHLGVAARAG
jgi:glycosyltransferase involved in cell wall biosynthesis